MVNEQINNKVGVIDVGSNSVRVMLSVGGKTLFKKIKVTRLAEGLGETLSLTTPAIERTALAVSELNALALNEGATKVYAFATAAVRQSKNGHEFTARVKELCGLTVEVIDGETEAELGYIGALNGKDGGVIDIGGASTEITVVKNGVPVYSKSIALGSVRVLTACGQNRVSAENFISEKIKEFGKVPTANFYGIGGTATSLSAVDLKLQPYDPNKTDGYKLTKARVGDLTEKLYNTPLEARKKLKGLQPERAEVICGGAQILLSIMDELRIGEITVSEKDNLEGYLIKKGEQNEQKN